MLRVGRNSSAQTVYYHIIIIIMRVHKYVCSRSHDGWSEFEILVHHEFHRAAAASQYSTDCWTPKNEPPAQYHSLVLCERTNTYIVHTAASPNGLMMTFDGCGRLGRVHSFDILDSLGFFRVVGWSVCLHVVVRRGENAAVGASCLTESLRFSPLAGWERFAFGRINVDFVVVDVDVVVSWEAETETKDANKRLRVYSPNNDGER